MSESDYGDVKDRDLLRMMFRQIEMADAFVLITARTEYDAPGWMIPELFYARALGLKVFHCCLETDAVPRLGDICYRQRFQDLLSGIQPQSEKACLQEILRWRGELSPRPGLDPLAHAELLGQWETLRLGKLSDRLTEWHEAEKEGFLPADAVFPHGREFASDQRLRRLGTWVGASGVVAELACGPEGDGLQYVQFDAATGEVSGSCRVPEAICKSMHSAGLDDLGNPVFLCGAPSEEMWAYAVGADGRASHFKLPGVHHSVSHSGIYKGLCWIGHHVVRIDTTNRTARFESDNAFPAAHPFRWLTLDPSVPRVEGYRFVDLADLVSSPGRGGSRPWTVLPCSFGVDISPVMAGGNRVPVVAACARELRLGWVEPSETSLAKKLRTFARQREGHAAVQNWPRTTGGAILTLMHTVFGLPATAPLRSARLHDGEDGLKVCVLGGDHHGRSGAATTFALDLPIEEARRLLLGAIGALGGPHASPIPLSPDQS